MIDLDFATGPMELGETRILRASGDAPFNITISCFVSDPPPRGFRPCEQCAVHTLAENQALKIVADETFWSDKTGGLLIDISDSVGVRHHVRIAIGTASGGRFTSPGLIVRTL